MATSVPSGDKGIQIEPLTKAEENEKAKARNITHVEDSPDYPADWKPKAKEIREALDKGFKYYRRTQGDRTYMLLRKGKHDLGLGAWDEEKEGKFFAFYPDTETMGGIEKPAPWVKDQSPTVGRSFAGVPIARPAIVPRDYIPTLNVIRYFTIVKDNGFPGTFSDFINDMVTHHMRDCHGVELPVVFRQSEEELEASFYGREE